MQVWEKSERRRRPVLAAREIDAGLVAIILIALSVRSPAAEPAERLRPDGIVGTVVLADVDSLPGAVVERFVQAAGAEEARLVIVVGREKPLDDDEQSKLLAPWKDAMPDGVETLCIATRAQAEDADHAELLHKATGIWLSNFDIKQLALIARGKRFAAELQAMLERMGVNLFE